MSSSPSIVPCPSCGGKNRLAGSASGGRPACGRCGHALPWLVDADAASFKTEVREAPLPVLVDFWAAWCGPCRMVAPALEELARDLAGRLKVVKVDVDQSPVLAAKHGAQSIPALLLFKDGEVVARTLGAQPKAALREMVEPHLGRAAS